MKDYNVHLTNTENYKVGTIFCIGQNYAKHIAEMGVTATSDPLVFIKPPQSILQSGDTMKLPAFSKNVHYEVELVLLIGKECQNISIENAKDYISAYGVGIDMTARDIQLNAKKEGNPWAVAKGFYQSAPISKFIPANELNGNTYFDLKLFLNGELRQSTNTKEMERSIEQLVSYLSQLFTLRAGDLIFTGTPNGVGKLNPGDKLQATLNDTIDLLINIE
ncbi:MAG TPA: fumarylacetoacetate hydrolase family protein [Candidatus Kapabacteria bacterium]|nr:fumarylacetoacetate hydrolase family protein [Candidatus Kapabacteria bacterium]